MTVEDVLFIGGELLVLVLCWVSALALTLTRRRAGWLAIPIGVALTFIAMLNFLGSAVGELWLLAYGPLIVAIMAWRLPLPDALLAIPAGPAIAYALTHPFSIQGADNPTAIVIGVCTLVFMIAGCVSGLAAWLRAYRSRKGLAHG